MIVENVKIQRRYFAWSVLTEEFFQILIAALQVGAHGYTVNVQYEQSNAEHFVGHSDGTKALMAASYLTTSHV